MRNIAAAALGLLLWCGATMAQETVHFASLDGTTALDGYLYRPPGEGRHPAVVGLHGCSGLFSRTTGFIAPIYREWAAELNRLGYVVLLVDSFRPRNHGEMCSILGFELDLYRTRPKDAYGALWYLRSQPFVRGDRIGLVGWSQGGGVALFSIGAQSLGRPANLPQGDFRAAVALYPGSCNIERQPSDWSSWIPLLVLMGAEDVWTPAAPCKTFLDRAIGRGAPIEMQIYPGAYHAFDAPNRRAPNCRPTAPAPGSCRSSAPTPPPGRTRWPASRPSSRATSVSGNTQGVACRHRPPTLKVAAPGVREGSGR
jgi:dienelactone hydrolase